MIKAFHVSLAAQYTLVQYSRAEPMHCSYVEFDDTGCFVPWDPAVPQSGYFQANCNCTAEFYVNGLCNAPGDTTWFAVWTMLNVLPPPDGTTGGECGGYDVAAYKGASRPNLSSSCQRTIKLKTGDKVWPVAGSNQQGLIVPPGSGCNYFEGKILY